MTQAKLSTDFSYPSQYIDVQGGRIHYIEQGKGDPIIFLSGMPGSSYLWRNVISHLSRLGRCIALDFFAFAEADVEYTLENQRQYLEKFIQILKLKRITFVLHGWDSIIGFDYAMQHESNCKGLVFYESYLRLFDTADIPLPYEEQVLLLKKQTDIKNAPELVKKLLVQSTFATLPQEVLQYYQAPFLQQEGSKLCSIILKIYLLVLAKLKQSKSLRNIHQN